VLSTLFWLLATWAYVTYTARPSLSRLALVCVMMALGLLAKPMLVTLPVTLLLLDVWPLGRMRLGLRKLLIEKIPLVVLSAAACVATIAAQSAGGAVASMTRFRSQSVLPTRPGRTRITSGRPSGPEVSRRSIPTPAHRFPPGRSFMAAALVVAMTALAFKLRRSYPFVLVGWLWYVATLLPVIGLVQVGSQGMADRYTYIPLIGIFIIVSWAEAFLAKTAVARRWLRDPGDRDRARARAFDSPPRRPPGGIRSRSSRARSP
jgi:hypothetical protein